MMPLESNKRFFNFTGVTKFHNAGYFGKRVKAATGERLSLAVLKALEYKAFAPIPGHEGDTGHPTETALTFLQVAPEAELYALPFAVTVSSSGQKCRLVDEAIPYIRENGILTMFTAWSTPYTFDTAPIDAALETVPDFFYSMSAGNKDSQTYNHFLDCERVYGTGAYYLYSDGAARPTDYTSVTDKVDFAAPSLISIPSPDGTWEYKVDGTSFSDPYMAGMRALIQDFFIDKTGKPLSRDMLYQFLKDHTVDIGATGKDGQAGWGAVVLPEPADIDVTPYVNEDGRAGEGISVTAEKIIETAASFVGVEESPAGSNNVVFNTEYYGREVSGSATFPWCCVFVWYVFRKAGAAGLFYGGGKTAYCPALASYARANGQWVTGDYRPGDLVMFNWHGTSIPEHIGIVESVGADGTVNTIEGNTSLTSDDNGGAVMRRARAPRYILGAVRPVYEEEMKMTEERIREIVREEIDKASPTYAEIRSVPEYWQAETAELLKVGAINGGTAADVNPNDVNMTRGELKAAIINKRYTDAKINGGT